MMLLFTSLLFLLALSKTFSLPKPAPVDEYPIHPDGGLVYDPLRREAERTGQLALYAKVPTTSRDIKLGNFSLSLSVPKSATAYDVVPIRYRLSWNSATQSFPVAVEATAFEDSARRKGNHLHDLVLPGEIDLKVDYLGSITAHLTPGTRHNLKPDYSDTPGSYPGFERRQLARSGVVEAGDLVWFKFQFTNTGNTILDPEGMGGCQLFPELFRKGKDGKWEFFGHPYNLYIRDLEYLYPGESHETWVHFMKNGPQETPQNFGLVPGEYLLKFRFSYRWYKEFNTFCNIWDGPPMYIWEMPFKVESKPRQAAVEPGEVTLTDADEPDKITRWIHTFEEFMTAFDCYISEPTSPSPSFSRRGDGSPPPSRRRDEGSPPPLRMGDEVSLPPLQRGDEGGSIDGTLHLQVAPWTKHVVVKLIGTDPVAINTVEVPIDVESDSLKVEFDPDHQMCVIRDGMREPVIWSQSMADMRTNVQHGPFPEVHIRQRMLEMMDCGVNVVAFTSMPWLYDDMHEPKSNYQGDAWKYFLDCAREEGMLAEGWGTYPYDRSSIQSIASWITGREFKMDNTSSDGYPCISHADPQLPAANAAAWLYQFHRWGDLYYQMENGEVPVGIEDTRGWMRQDIHTRHPEHATVVAGFREWLSSKYGSVDAANKAWGTSYKSFEEVDPQANQVPNKFGHKWEYSDQKHPFHDWNQAVEDWDEYRTMVRAKNYRDTLDIVRKEIPGVRFLLRTEGGNVLVSGIDPESPNSHFRHIYYSQRRCGIVAEVLRRTGEVRYHSDYTTMPYTPSELRGLTRTAVKQGIIPIYLAQFDNLRDIAINTKYGTEYQTNYNLPEPRKGQMMHVLTALYPWFTAAYEEGGVPGILWEDYQCDGFATETQKREMKFFKQKLSEALNAPAAKKARAADIKQPDQSWRKGSKAMRSYGKRD